MYEKEEEVGFEETGTVQTETFSTLHVCDVE